ncbi:ABC-three component system protein [Rhizobium sp. RAF36]|uniref:ABC-three component system protein n=1 Tax=Rhizobium sp. RAF36 TaxID=3233055 RepID=UPI003F9CA3D9
MTSTAIRLTEIDDDQLEDFIDIWAEKKSKDYVMVERLGSANDKGRDVVGFLSSSRHEGEWDLYQCKRKTRNSKLGTGEATAELGKLFYHHLEGAYATLPRKYVFVSPRGIVGPFLTLLRNPSTLKAHLLSTWNEHCRTKITRRNVVELTPEIKSAIEAYDFGQIEYLTATMIVKDPAAKPALVQILKELPGEAPEGEAPASIAEEEMGYVTQLRAVYGQVAGVTFPSIDDVFADPTYGEHLKVQRTRFYEACAFRDFHRDNTAQTAVDTFKKDIYHLLYEVYYGTHSSRFDRANAVLLHTGAAPADILGRSARGPVKQGMCHHLVIDGKISWNP